MIILNKIIALITALITLFTGAQISVDIDFISPYLSVIPDAAAVGIDYLTLERNENAVSKKELLQKINDAQSAVSHPFVLAEATSFNRARKEYKDGNGSDYVNELTKTVFKYADSLLSTELLVYALDEEDAILEISREAFCRVTALAYAWQITGNSAYADRAWQELENVCAFKDWCTDHFLDAAEMALAVSVGYDWLFGYLTPQQKQLLCETTWKYAIEPALSVNYLKNWFTWSKTNWNSICYSGIGIACMTFAQYNPEKAARFLSMAYKNMPIAFEAFTPDGVYGEGSGYWKSGTGALVYFVESSRNFFGTDFGLSDIDGFRQLGSFPVYITTPNSVFNYGDNKSRIPCSPVLHRYADEYGEPLLSAFQMSVSTEKQLEDGSEFYHVACESALSLLWYNRQYTTQADSLGSIPKSVMLDSDGGEQLVTMRSAYLDASASYAAIKGGCNYTNHGDLDIGTFMYESMGVRWTEELGPGSYDAPGYFVGLPGFGRWKNYCKRAEGQNTLVINPSVAADDQYPLARCGFTSFEATENGGKAVLDMSEAYSLNMAKSVIREFELTDNYSRLSITDAISCKINSEIYWFMHTKADIELMQGGKTARLTVGDKSLRATLSSDGEFSVMDASALGGAYEYDAQYEDIHKLAVHINGVRDAVISVTLEPWNG